MHLGFRRTAWGAVRALAIGLGALPFAAQDAAAQSNVASATYAIGIADGKAGDFVQEPSYLGFDIDFHFFKAERLSFGGVFAWNYFEEVSQDVVEFDGGAVAGTQVRYLGAMPLLAGVRYWLGDYQSKVTPFVGFYAGTMRTRQRFEIGVYAFETTDWHFAAAPEAGISIPFEQHLQLVGRARLNYAFDSGERLGGDEDNTYAYWSLNLGVGWTF